MLTQSMNPSMLLKASRDAGIPLLLLGPPGIGKTEIVKSLFGFTEVVLLSSETEDSLSGLPYREGKVDYRTIPALFRRLHDAATQGLTTCLFLDELDKASRTVSDTLLTLVASRRMGEARLPDKVAIIAAANPPEMGGGDGVSSPMLNRFSIIEMQPNKDSWVEWAKKRYTGTPAIKVALEVHHGNIPLFECVGEGLSQRITSPRSLQKAMDAINVFTSHEDKNSLYTLLKGLLTPDTAGKIYHSLDFYSEYSDVLKRSKEVVGKARAARAAAAVAQVTAVNKPVFIG